MKNNCYYWVKVGGINHEYIPMYRNHSGQWKHETLTGCNFISDYKLKLLYGKDCVIREVNFDNDQVVWERDDLDSLQKLEFFVIESDNSNPVVMFGSPTVWYYQTANAWQINKFDVDKILKFTK